MKKPRITFRMIRCLATCERTGGDYSTPRSILVKQWGASTVKGVETRELVEEFLDGGLILTDTGRLILSAFRVGSNLQPAVARMVSGAACKEATR
jgi:hypothetical protein